MASSSLASCQHEQTKKNFCLVEWGILAPWALKHHKFGPMVKLEHKPRVDWRLLPHAGHIPNVWESSKVHVFLNHVTLRPSDDANYLVPICNLPDPIWEHHGHHCIETPLHCHVGIYHLNVKDSCKTHCWTTWLFLFDKKDKNKLDWKVNSLQIQHKLEMDDSNILHGGQNVVTWLASCPWSSKGLSDPNHFQCGDLLLVSRPSEGHQSFLKRRDGEGPRNESECRSWKAKISINPWLDWIGWIRLNPY